MNVCFLLARAVKNLHDKKVAHGNLKLQNVLLDSDWNLVLSDLSIEPKNNELANLKPDKLPPSHIYVAPELKPESKPFAKPDFRSDIWSLGVLYFDIV